MDRRAFLWNSACGLIALAGAGCLHDGASSGSAAKPLIDLGPSLVPGTTDKRTAPPLLRSANYTQHVNRTGTGSEYNLGGVDYAPVRFFAPTEVCAIAAGVVMGVRDNDKYGGMVLECAHGLGWKSTFAHLQARYVGFPTHVLRREILAIMGKTGQGASRSGIMEEHLHLTVRGPAYSPLYKGIAIQEFSKATPRWRYVFDPEELSLNGKGQSLPYSRVDDASLDEAYLAKHAAAVHWCDTLLDRLADEDATKAKTRERWEVQAKFDAHVDERMWFLWQRLEKGPHPFSPTEIAAHRATLLDFMTTVPRFTAPIVESDRRKEYRLLRSAPIKVYGQT